MCSASGSKVSHLRQIRLAGMPPVDSVLRGMTVNGLPSPPDHHCGAPAPEGGVCVHVPSTRALVRPSTPPPYRATARPSRVRERNACHGCWLGHASFGLVLYRDVRTHRIRRVHCAQHTRTTLQVAVHFSNGCFGAGPGLCCAGQGGGCTGGRVLRTSKHSAPGAGTGAEDMARVCPGAQKLVAVQTCCGGGCDPVC